MRAAGVQLVKLTPYRSYISISVMVQCICFLSILGLKGGVLSYSAVSTLSQYPLLSVPFFGIIQHSLPPNLHIREREGLWYDCVHCMQGM